jgi:hypothetical protein
MQYRHKKALNLGGKFKAVCLTLFLRVSVLFIVQIICHIFLIYKN